jgi:predicted O-methyltransferase YrrM
MEKRGAYLEEKIKQFGWRRGAELGVWYGQTYFRLLENCPNLILVGVDNWLPENAIMSHHKDHAANRAEVYEKKAKYPHRAFIIESDTTCAALRVRDRSLDFVFVDAGHSYESCRTDIITWLPKIKSGGWMLGHDYDFPSVAKAVQDSLEGFQPGVRETDYIWSWIKP